MTSSGDRAPQQKGAPRQKSTPRIGPAIKAPKLRGPRELTNRSVYPTPIGPVCMSKTEHEAYLAELEMRGMLQDGS